MPPVFPARERSRLVLCSRTGLRSHGAERPRRTGMNHGCGEGPLTQHPMLASGRQDMAGRPHPRPCPGLPLRTAKCGGAGCALCKDSWHTPPAELCVCPEGSAAAAPPNVRQDTGAGGREPWRFTPGRYPAKVTLLGASFCPGTGPLPPGVRPVKAAGSAGPCKAALLPQPHSGARGGGWGGGGRTAAGQAGVLGCHGGCELVSCRLVLGAADGSLPLSWPRFPHLYYGAADHRGHLGTDTLAFWRPAIRMVMTDSVS